MVRIAAFPIIVSLQSGAAIRLNNTVFCETTSIDISPHIKSKVSGKIYSPNQLPRRYYGGPDEQERSCSLQITGLRNHYIIIHHDKTNTLGPCLQNLEVGNNQTRDACISYKQKYLSRENQDNGIVLSVEITNQIQPEFVLSFTIYPLFILGRGVKFINTTATPEGYLMSSPTSTSFQATWSNFPPTSIINIEIIDLYINVSSGSGFNIELRGVNSGNDMVSSFEQSLAYYGSSAKYIPFRFAAQQQKSLSIILRDLNINSLGLLGFSTVAQCDSQIKHLKTLVPTSHIYNHSSFYMAECSAGYMLKNGNVRYACDNDEWIPELQCQWPLTTVQTNSQPPPQPGNSSDAQRNHSSWNSDQRTILLCVGLVIAVIMTVALATAMCSKYRKRSIDIPTTERVALESATAEQFETTEVDPEAGHAEETTDSSYDIIDDVDPYVDYAQINESEMMNHSLEPAYKPDLQPTSNPTYGHHIERCNQSNRNENGTLQDGCCHPARCDGSKSQPKSPYSESIYHHIWDPKTKKDNQLETNNQSFDRVTPHPSRLISWRDRRSTPRRVCMNQTSRLPYTDDLVYADINQIVYDSPYLTREDGAKRSQRQEISRAPLSLAGSSKMLAHGCGELGESELDSRVDKRWQPAQLSRSQSMHCLNSCVV